MSQQLISRSPDLKRLRDDGYDIEIKCAHLLVKGVPYVNGKREVAFGILACPLDMANDVTVQPQNHVTFFVGEYPCDHQGAQLAKMVNDTPNTVLGPDLTLTYSFSRKPLTVDGRYPDYYDKMTAYVAMLLSEARHIDPHVQVRTYKPIPADDPEAVFHYLDTASSKAQINQVSAKLELANVNIVGLGGTGSYILDLVAKTPVKEIHLFDGDTFLQHNAFRAPGAASRSELEKQRKKVDYFAESYSAMRRGIVPHPYFIDESNIADLKSASFVFLCIHGGPVKQLIVGALTEWDIPFVDVGMGIELVDGALRGTVRVTTSSREKRDHVAQRVSFAEAGDDEYDKNIQVADLNALNAVLAVVKWKKLFGFYHDFVREHDSSYTIDSNLLEDRDHL